MNILMVAIYGLVFRRNMNFVELVEDTEAMNKSPNPYVNMNKSPTYQFIKKYINKEPL